MSYGFQTTQPPLEEDREYGGKAKYTLPGIMQYLQGQFSQAERNRMQSDLEKSSLKLKIIELEHERNMLIRKNADLLQEVGQLKSKLGLDSAPKPSSSDLVPPIDSVDIDKLVKAKQFLKSATNEIIYLLKSPLLELDDPGCIDKDELYTNVRQSPINRFRDDSYSSNGVASPYSLKEDNNNIEHEFNVIADSDQATIIDVEDGPEDQIITNSNAQSQDTILKKAKKYGSPRDLGLTLNDVNAGLELRLGKLFISYPESKLTEVYDNINKESEMICKIEMPARAEIVDVVSNEDYLVVLTKTEIIVHTIGQDSKPIKYPCESPLMVDLEDAKLLVAFAKSVEILKIVANKEIKVISSHALDLDEELRKVKFIKHHEQYDMVILTPSALSFYNVENTRNNELLKLLNDVQLSNYTDWLLTSMNLIVNFEHGIYLFDFGDDSEFKSVVVPSDQSKISIGDCADEETAFYVIQDNQLTVFESTSVGTISQLKTVDGLVTEQGCCLGVIDGAKFVLAVKEQSIIAYSV